MFAVLKREFRSYFQNVIGWLFVAALMALFGLYFYVYNLRQGYPYLYYTLSAITIIFMIAVPILTMRSFAEDRKNKTDQLMLTAPVPVAKVVLGKYLAMLAVFTVDIAVFCVTPLILRAFGTIPMGESYIAILAFWLYGAASIAVGMFISALTESQVIAAVLTFVVLFISYMMQSLTGLISSDGNWLTKILNGLDLYAPFEKFQGGCLDITAILYYVTVIVLFNFFTVQAIQKRRWSISKKTFSLSVFSSSFIVVVLALAVVANLAVDALPTRITSVDCSYSKLYSITKDTKKTMKKLKSNVTIYVLAAEKSKDAQIDSMLERYKDLSGHIRVKYVNPKSKPYFYKDYTDNAPTSNSLIVVSDKRSKVIDYYDIYDYQSNMDYSTYSYNNELKGFDAEGQITSAIQYVTMDADQLPVVYQITGHDEATIGSAFSDVISKSNMTLSSVEMNCDVEEIKLASMDSLSVDDCEMIMILGPTKDYSKDEAQKVIDYLKKGGKAVIVGLYSETEMPNFASILDTYGVSLTTGPIADNDAQHYYNMGGPLYLLPNVNSSSYTGSLSGGYVYLPISLGINYPQNSTTDDTESTEESKTTYTSLLDTSDDAVAKNNPNSMQDYGYEDGDDKGPFSVGLAVEDKVDDDHTTQLVVFASPYVFSDDASQMTTNNASLFSDVIGNMITDTQSAGSVIPEKEYTLSNLTVNALHAALLGLLVTIILPILLLAGGIVIFMVRRKK